ncbi:MAG: nucleotidyltransferase family protein [Calditrichaeota bacterium]|nr:nucleotidyltransferase family protein [Calditrichota bacterium]
MIPAILLSAGDSRRMGVPKALLKLPNGQTFLEAIAERLRAGGFSPILLILGHDAPVIRPFVPEAIAEVLVNLHPENGQLSSFQMGIRHLPENVPGCLMALIDHPLIAPETYRKMAVHIRLQPENITVPSKDFKKGHPTYFPARFFEEILATPLEKGARQILKNHPEAVDYVLVEDDGIFVDFDTPEAYQRYFGVERLQSALKIEEKR